MDENIPKLRIGIIRVDEALWSTHSEAIKESFGPANIRSVNQSPGPFGTYLRSFDIILERPEFDEVTVDPNAAIRRYECEFFPNDDGSVTIGPIYS